MPRRERFILVILCLFWITSSNAQSVANYAVSRTTGITYSSISTSGSAIPSWRNTTSFTQDDNRSYFIPIGFDFWYDGTRYTQLSVSTNGFIDFSSSTDDGGPIADAFGYANAAFTQAAAANATRPALAPFYDDLMAQGGTDPLGNSIRYSLTGSAGSRVFTVEWINMAIYTNVTPSLNFQVKLYEGTGVIEYLYSTMNSGTHTFSYTCGINAPNVSNTPTAAQLKTQQTANTATFSNTVQNNLSVMPAANSKLSFVPPVPANPVSGLTFSSVTQTSMNVNWTNWATNEVGYAVYYSYDGINYYFAGQTAANATTYAATGLWPGTTYQWRVFAVTEGALSNASTGTQSTSAATVVYSNVTNGNWNTPGTWTSNSVPTAGDNVVIRNGHTVTVNVTNAASPAVCNNLQIGEGTSGTLRMGVNGNPVYLKVNGNISINTGASFSVPTNSNNQTNMLYCFGKILNNGTMDFKPDNNSFANIEFNRNSSQSFTGSAALTRLNLITLNIGSSSDDRLDVSVSNLNLPNNFLTLNSGTFHYSGNDALTMNVSTTTYSIPFNTGLWMDGANATMQITQDVDLRGVLRITQGTFNAGTVAEADLNSNGGDLFIEGGTLNVGGRYTNVNQNTISKFQISGGTMIVPSVSTAINGQSPFQITSPGAVFNMSGGTIVIRNKGGTGAQNLGFTVNNVSFSNVTDGTLQIGNASTTANSIININTSVPVGNLLVNRSTATALLNTNPLTVVKNVTITAGTFNTNNLNVTLGGNWTDNDVFVPGTSTVTFNGSTQQSINDPNGETFNHLVAGGTGGVLLNTDITTNGNLTINSSLDVSAANKLITTKRNWTNNGSFVAQSGKVIFSGTVAQIMNGSSTTDFYDLEINNTAGVSAQTSTFGVRDAIFPVAGNLNAAGAAAFILYSDAAQTARIAPRTSGTLSGTFTVQRFISARAAGYSDMSSPVSNATFADWSADMLMIYGYNPPNVYPSAWSYSESLWDYVPVTSAATAITPGKGYELWLDSYGNYTSFNATTIDTKGIPNQGTINVSSQITHVNDGWNLIGNPYASFVSWDNLLSSSTQVASTIMIYDETIGDFATFTSGSGIELAPHQGFWIQTTGTSAAFSFTENHKTTSVNSSYRNSDVAFVLRIKQNDAGKLFSSGTRFIFNDQAENGKDEHDITFLKLPHPEAPALFSVSENYFLRDNYLPSSSFIQIPVYCKVGVSGTYTMKPENLDYLLAGGYSCARVYDKKMARYFDLLSDEEYNFDASISDDPDRFILVLSSEGSECVPDLSKSNGSGNVSVLQTPDNIRVNLALGGSVNARVEMMDMNGKLIHSIGEVSPTGTITLPYPVVAGMYLMSVSCGDFVKTEKVLVR
ncbi:MAG: T9SS type A sorting domain-containing protein [Flavobacteriales bacterium]|nr:T9SS type A sorting domain-containing protein [Flavobacteriales bacterium]